MNGTAIDPHTHKLSRQILGWNFISGFAGARIGQSISNPRGAPPILFGTSIAGARSSTEQIRAQLGQLVQALTSLLSSLQSSQQSQQSNTANNKRP
jgi:hypothetical protein